MDIVITYVDNSDPVWLNEFNKYYSEEYDVKSSDEARFQSWENLRYCLRSIALNAPFIRKVHLIVSGPSQVPNWINKEEVNIVYHKDIIPEEYLPTFNSRTIEMCMHNIKDLDEQFIYFNDDMFLLNPCLPEDFFKNDNAIIHIQALSAEIIKKWGKSPLYLEPHKRCTDEVRRLFPNKNGIYYIMTDHGPCSMIKSLNKELFELLKDKIIKSLTRFRTKNDFVHFIYTVYTFYKGRGNVCPTKAIYLTDRDSISKMKYCLFYEKNKRICINNIQYKSKENEVNTFMNEVNNSFSIRFPNISKYEVNQK